MKIGLFIFVFLSVYAPAAYAYIDPNIGLLLTQGLIAAFGALLFAVRQPREALRNLFKRIFKRKSKKTEPDDA